MSNIIHLSAFAVGGPQKPLEDFLDDADILWYCLNRYGEENSLTTEQIFFVYGNEVIRKRKDNTLFTFHPVPSRRSIHRLFSFWLYLLKKRGEIKIFHTNTFGIISFPTVALMKILRVKTAHFIHIYDFDNVKFRERNWLKLYFNVFVDCIIIHDTEHFRKWVPTFTRKPIHIFNQGVDTHLFKPISVNEKRNDKFKILYLSRLHPEKKIEDIINGISLMEKKDKVELWIVGGGEQDYRDSISSLLQKENICYKFFGYVPLSELPRFYSEADIFVNMRPDESFAKVFIEAMACGTPIIGRKGSPGAEAIIDSKNGFIVKDEKELANVLSELVGNRLKLEPMRAYCRKLVEEKYSYENSYQSLSQAYDKLISKSAGEADIEQGKT